MASNKTKGGAGPKEPEEPATTEKAEATPAGAEAAPTEADEAKEASAAPAEASAPPPPPANPPPPPKKEEPPPKGGQPPQGGGPSEPAPHKTRKQSKSFGDSALRVSVAGLRTLVPIINAYGRSPALGSGPIEAGGETSLSAGEMTALRSASEKLIYETAAVLRTPAGEPVKLPERDKETQEFPPLSVLDFIALGKAIQSVLASTDDPEPLPPDEDDTTVTHLSTYETRQMLMRRTPTDYPAPTVSRPLVSRELRGTASPRPVSASARSVAGQGRLLAAQGTEPAAPAPTTQPAAPAQSSAPVGGSNFHASGCGCASCRGGHSRTKLSRRTEAGDCDPKIFSMSCETQSRLKGCLKQVICDFLWCAESHICPDGEPHPGLFKPSREKEEDDPNGQNDADDEDDEDKFDIGAVFLECLGAAACSAIRCVPEALCPPEPVECDPRPVIDCSGYAVEERS